MDEIKVECLLKQLKAAQEQCRLENTGKMDITPSQCFLLYYLLTADAKKLCAADIYRKLGISRVSISAILKTLRRKGYLTMQEDFMDERKKKIFLTRKDYEKKGEIEIYLKEREERLCEGIPQENLEVFESVINRMILNLKKKDETEENRHDKNIVETGKAV